MGRFSTNIKTLLTNTEDDVEAFECDEVGDGDASLVLLLLRSGLLIVIVIIVLVVMNKNNEEDDNCDILLGAEEGE